MDLREFRKHIRIQRENKQYSFQDTLEASILLRATIPVNKGTAPPDKERLWDMETARAVLIPTLEDMILKVAEELIEERAQLAKREEVPISLE